MTKTEALKVMAILQAAFPAFYRGVTKESATASVNLWAQMFSEETYQEVSAAVMALIGTQVEGYPPTIGAVKQMLSKLRAPEKLTPQEAWNLVVRAVEGNTAWKDLPDAVKSAIGSPSTLREWGMMDISAFNSVVYSNFIKAYTAIDNRERVKEMLPGTIKSMLNGSCVKAIEG